MTCPVEKRMIELLQRYDIDFRRPENELDDPTTLDFYLPEFKLYIEVKQFHTARITAQLAKVPQGTTAIVLIGPRSVSDFERLCKSMVE